MRIYVPGPSDQDAFRNVNRLLHQSLLGKGWEELQEQMKYHRHWQLVSHVENLRTGQRVAFSIDSEGDYDTVVDLMVSGQIEAKFYCFYSESFGEEISIEELIGRTKMTPNEVATVFQEALTKQ